MKTVFVSLMLLPILGFSQMKNVLTANRVFPKVDKVLEFEKALANHAQKYHSGDARWRVFEIATGPDAGGYHITEGPSSWDAIDKRGNLGDEHNVDWNKSVAIYLTDRGSSSYSIYQDTLSSVALTDYSDNIQITHWYPKIGYGNEVRNTIYQMKKTWQASGETVAVYAASGSGPAQFTLVTRYKQGLKEREAGFRKPFKERFEAVNGEDSFDGYLKTLKELLADSWSEMLSYRADISSK